MPKLLMLATLFVSVFGNRYARNLTFSVDLPSSLLINKFMTKRVYVLKQLLRLKVSDSQANASAYAILR